MARCSTAAQRRRGGRVTFSVERADKFLELAQGQANENESRNAAMMLVRLLSRAGFNFANGFSNRSNQEFIELQRKTELQDKTIDGLIRDRNLLRTKLSVANLQIEALEDKVNNLKYKSRAEESRREQAYERQEPEVEWRLITNRYESVCQKCRQPIFKNEQVYWAKGKGVVHKRCHS